MSVLYGLIAAFAWGSADFMAANAARSIGAVRTLFAVQLQALVMLALVLIHERAELPALQPMLVSFGIGLAYAVGTFLLYRALSIGTLAVVSPIVSSYTIVSSILAYLHGARPAPLVVLGTAMLVVGMALISRGANDEKKASLRGVPESVIASLLFGAYYWFIQFPVRSIGPYWPTVATRVSAISIAWLAWKAFGKPDQSPARFRSILPFMLAAAALDNVAFVVFNHGMVVGRASVVLPLSSQFGAITMILGWIFFQERVQSIQRLGALVILAGIVIVSV